VQEEHVVAADVVTDLPSGLQERQRLDVADGAADLGDDDVDAVLGGPGHRPDPLLDLVGDVRDHLHGLAEVVTATLLGDHLRVHLAGGHVRDPGEVGVEEPLVVADVEVGLGAVVGHEDLAVLERVHRPGVHVEVRVELLHRHAQPAGLQQAAQRGGGEPLAERGGDASGDEDVLGRLRCGQVNSRGVEARSGARSDDVTVGDPRGFSLATPPRRRSGARARESSGYSPAAGTAPGIAPSAASTAP
jgi:hypothetical protein